jgi:hypothetical protein
MMSQGSKEYGPVRSRGARGQAMQVLTTIEQKISGMRMWYDKQLKDYTIANPMRNQRVLDLMSSLEKIWNADSQRAAAGTPPHMGILFSALPASAARQRSDTPIHFLNSAAVNRTVASSTARAHTKPLFLHLARQRKAARSDYHGTNRGELRSYACAHHLLREDLISLHEGAQADAEHEDRGARADGDPWLLVAPLKQREPLLGLDQLGLVQRRWLLARSRAVDRRLRGRHAAKRPCADSAKPCSERTQRLVGPRKYLVRLTSMLKI